MRAIIIFLSLPGFLFSASLKLKAKILLNPQNRILQSNAGIALLDNGSILFSDSRACNFKVFDRKGMVVKTFGRKGEGPNEFSNNTLLNYQDGRALIMNIGKLKLLLCRITNNLEFIEEQDFGLFALDAAIANDDMVVARMPEYDSNQTLYTLFGLHLRTKKRVKTSGSKDFGVRSQK